MGFICKLRDGSFLEGDDFYNQPGLTNVIQRVVNKTEKVIYKPKWYEFWKTEITEVEKSESYNVVVLSDTDILYHALTGMKKEDVIEYFDSVDAFLEKMTNKKCDCDDCEDLDDGVDEIPNGYFKPEPVDLKLYN